MEVLDGRDYVIHALQLERIASKHYALFPKVAVVQRLKRTGCGG
jgi:hypothetical protein